MSQVQVYEKACSMHSRSNSFYEFKKALVIGYVVFDMILSSKPADYFSLWISPYRSKVTVPSLDGYSSVKKDIKSQTASFILDRIAFYFATKDEHYIEQISDKIGELIF